MNLKQDKTDSIDLGYPKNLIIFMAGRLTRLYWQAASEK